jgi:hypothetical protein
MAAKTGTYTLINSTTLNTATATVTFSSIPSAYTDLVLVAWGGVSGNEFGLQFNSDSGTNYGQTALAGNGSTATSTRNTNYNGVGMGGLASRSAPAIVNILDYSNSTTFKASLIRGEQTRSAVESVIAFVNTWRNTSAITSITIRDLGSSNNIASGSTFRLYGIEAAK